MKYQYFKLLMWTLFFTGIIAIIITITRDKPPKKYAQFKVISTKQIVLIEDTIYTVGDTVELDRCACACRVPGEISDNWGNENNIKAIKLK